MTKWNALFELTKYFDKKISLNTIVNCTLPIDEFFISQKSYQMDDFLPFIERHLKHPSERGKHPQNGSEQQSQQR